MLLNDTQTVVYKQFTMDARIQAIMATYDQDEKEEEKKKEAEVIPEPPRTLEEWIQMRPEGFQDWPDPLEPGEGELNLTVNSVGIGGLEEIMADLEVHAPLDIGLIDDVNEQIVDLEKQLSFYTTRVLSEGHEDTERNSVEKGVVLSPASLRVLNYEHDDEVVNRKKKSQAKFGAGDDQTNRMKSVQYTMYPGFFPSEMTPLPGQLEAPQLLNKVTKAQNFSKPFRNVWKKLFLSEGSVAVLQDTFWWFFLDKFQCGSKNAQDGLFSRIADSFVALFFGVSHEYKDRFFQYYADCLSQAVYAAYCEVFPRSYSLFDDEFKSHLLNTISEWVTGTRPPPCSWQKWNFKLLEPANIRELQDDRTESLKANMTFDLEASLEEMIAAGSERRLTYACGVSTPSRMLLKPETESHEMGPGPKYERVGFNILGRSPLVAHFLKMKQLLSSEQEIHKTVDRTEVASLPPPAPTYRQVIKETKKTSKTLGNHYQRVLDTSVQESIKIQKQKRAALAKLQKLKTDLVLRNQDIKSISERLLDLMTQPDYTSPGYPCTVLEHGMAEDDSDELDEQD